MVIEISEYWNTHLLMNSSLYLLMASIIVGGVVWFLIVGKDHKTPSRAIRTVYTTRATGCIDLWISYHPNIRPTRKFKPCCRWLFVYGLQPPLAAFIRYVQDLIGQADVFFNEEVEVTEIAPQDIEAGEAA